MPIADLPAPRFSKFRDSDLFGLPDADAAAFKAWAAHVDAGRIGSRVPGAPPVLPPGADNLDRMLRTLRDQARANGVRRGGA